MRRKNCFLALISESTLLCPLLDITVSWYLHGYPIYLHVETIKRKGDSAVMSIQFKWILGNSASEKVHEFVAMSMNSKYDTVKYLSLYIDSMDIIKCICRNSHWKYSDKKERRCCCWEVFDKNEIIQKDTVSGSHTTLPHHYRLLLVYNSMGRIFLKWSSNTHLDEDSLVLKCCASFSKQSICTSNATCFHEMFNTHANLKIGSKVNNLGDTSGNEHCCSWNIKPNHP